MIVTQVVRGDEYEIIFVGCSPFSADNSKIVEQRLRFEGMFTPLVPLFRLTARPLLIKRGDKFSALAMFDSGHPHLRLDISVDR